MVKTEWFSLRSKTRQGCWLLPLLFNNTQEALGRVTRPRGPEKKKEEKRKGIHPGKEVKLHLLANGISHIENPKEHTCKLAELINK